MKGNKGPTAGLTRLSIGNGLLYTPLVHRSTAWLLVLLIAAITASDPICCADGCARPAATVTQFAPVATSDSGTDCPFCLGALDTRFEPPSADMAEVASIEGLPAALPALLLATPIHPPPRNTV
jgi:hypothetical protein